MFDSAPRLASVATFVVASMLGAAALAAPGDDAVDPVAQLLVEKGVAAPPATAHKPSLAERARDKASDMVLTAMGFLGVPYRRGGSNETAGFDCSGFTRHIFDMGLGLVLPRRVDEQAKAPGLVAVQRNELQPGDLVFFNTLKRNFSHVGIYIGAGKFIHSPRPGGEVRVEDMGFSYWKKRFTGARRAELAVASIAPAAAAPAELATAPP